MAVADHNSRRGRGRLSSIDRLPDEADPDVAWAIEALRDRKMHQNAILAEFNARLADRGLKAISKSAFSRWSVRKAIQFRKLDEVRRISNELISMLGTDGPDDVTVATAEMVKLAAFQMLENPEDLSSKSVMELSRALASAVNAQKGSAEYRRKLQAEVDERLKKAAEAVEEAGAKAGVGEDTLKKITSLLTTGAA